MTIILNLLVGQPKDTDAMRDLTLKINDILVDFYGSQSNISDYN